jgi:hypothetical protein
MQQQTKNASAVAIKDRRRRETKKLGRKKFDAVFSVDYVILLTSASASGPPAIGIKPLRLLALHS